MRPNARPRRRRYDGDISVRSVNKTNFAYSRDRSFAAVDYDAIDSRR